MNLDGIRLFILSVKHRNITQAAHELRISQSAASRQIKQLEVDLGTKLFVKNGRGKKLTHSGQSFLNEMLPLWSRFDELRKKYAPAPGSVTIAASHVPSHYLLPALMTEFSKKHPGVNLKLLTRSSVEIEKMLLESSVDLALTTDSNMPATGFVTEPYSAEPLTAFIAADHSLAQTKLVRASEMDTVPLIIKSSRNGESKVEAQLGKMEKAGIKFKTVIRCETPDVVKEFVRQKAGVGCLYYNSIRRGIDRGEFKTIQFPGLDVVALNYIVYSRERPLSSLAREFLSSLRASVANLGPIKPALVRQSSKGSFSGRAHDYLHRLRFFPSIISLTAFDWSTLGLA